LRASQQEPPRDADAWPEAAWQFKNEWTIHLLERIRIAVASSLWPAHRRAGFASFVPKVSMYHVSGYLPTGYQVLQCAV
jgi:hypothetical protein